MKQTIIAWTAAAILVPLASAGAGDDGNISRTFLYTGAIEWQDSFNGYGGVGWYSPNNPDNLCLVSMYGLGLGAGFYYETGRVAGNDVNHGVAGGGEAFVGVYDTGCPSAINPDGSSDTQFIGTTDANVVVGNLVDQSHLLCSAVSTAVFCNPDGASSVWTVRDCDDPFVDFDQGDFLLLGSPASVMSSRAGNGECLGGSDTDLTDHLNPLNNYQSSFPAARIAEVVPPGHGSSYAVSCFRMDYDRISLAGSTAETAVSHDYFLVLDASDAPQWPAYLAHHVGPPTGGANPDPVVVPAPLSVAGNGFYDLNGDNDSPFVCQQSFALMAGATPECSDGDDDDWDTTIDATDPGCHTDGNAANQFSYDPLDASEGTDANLKCGRTLTGIAGSTATCTGWCSPASAPGFVNLEARWLGGPSSVKTSVTGCATGSVTVAPGGGVATASTPFGTPLGTFTCTIEIVAGATPTSGMGSCTWAPDP